MKVIVYQMGKVGSGSVHRSLVDHGGVDVEHIHEVDPEYVRYSRGVGRGSPEWERVARLRKLMAGDEPLKVITLVREPIARNVSLLWEDFGVDIKSDPKAAQRLWKVSPHDEVLTWFDRELKQFLGIDVYEYPFDRQLGVRVICQGLRRVLILKCETDDEVKQTAVSSFLGLHGFKLSRHTVNKSPAYADLKKCFKVTRAYADKMAAARYTRHFYSDDEIDVMRERWTER